MNTSLTIWTFLLTNLKMMFSAFPRPAKSAWTNQALASCVGSPCKCNSFCQQLIQVCTLLICLYATENPQYHLCSSLLQSLGFVSAIGLLNIMFFHQNCFMLACMQRAAAWAVRVMAGSLFEQESEAMTRSTVHFVRPMADSMLTRQSMTYVVRHLPHTKPSLRNTMLPTVPTRWPSTNLQTGLRCSF